MAFRKVLSSGVVIVFVAAAFLSVSAGDVRQFDQPAKTQAYQTIDAIVAERFGATATQQAIYDEAATNIALTQVAPTQTAAFNATVDARFDEAVTGTAQVVLQTGTPTAPPPEIDIMLTNAAAQIVTVKDGAVPALRTCAATSCSTVRNLRAGERLRFVGVDGAWLEVETDDGEHGFVSLGAVNIGGVQLPSAVSPTATATQSVTETSSDLTTPKADGFYRVGVDIAAGKWESQGSGSTCYWARTSRAGDILDNHFGLSGGTVFVQATDYEVEFSDCGTFEYVEDAARELEATASSPKRDGVYTVGVEIAAGEWRSEPGETQCYWSLIDDTGEIVNNHYGDSGGVVRVTDDVYEVEFDGCGTFALDTGEAPPVETPDELTLGTPLTGFLDGASDSFPLEASAGDAFFIAMSSPDFDPRVEVSTRAGRSVGSDDDSGTGQNARLLFVAPSTDTFTVDAGSFLDRGTGIYTLTVLQSSGTLALDEAVEIEMDGRTSYLYEFEAEANDSYAISADSGGRLLASTVDTNLTLFDASGTELEYADDTNSLDPEITSYRFRTAGTYYIILAPYNENAVGEVALVVEQD